MSMVPQFILHYIVKGLQLFLSFSESIANLGKKRQQSRSRKISFSGKNLK